jgi:hypothetical protein
MKWIVLLLLGAGCVAGLLAWRSATEAPRRYAETIGLIAAHREETAVSWSERDAARLWENILWFLDRQPLDLSRRVRDSVLEGKDRAEAMTMALTILRFDGQRFQPIVLNVEEGMPLPRPGSSEAFRAEPFALPDVLLSSVLVVDLLAESKELVDRLALLKLMFCDREVPDHAWKRFLRLSAEEPDAGVRAAAVLLLRVRRGRVGVREALARLAGDSVVSVRLAALGALAEGHDAQAGREAFLGALQAPGLSRSERLVALLFLADSMYVGSALGLELKAFVLESNAGICPESWELAERLGDALERKAVGDFDLPLLEDE